MRTCSVRGIALDMGSGQPRGGGSFYSLWGHCWPLCAWNKGGLKARGAGLAAASVHRPHRYQYFGDKGVVPEPGRHAGAETHKQDHRPEDRLLQAWPPPGSARCVAPLSWATQEPGVEASHTLWQVVCGGRNQHTYYTWVLGQQAVEAALPPSANPMCGRSGKAQKF